MRIHLLIAVVLFLGSVQATTLTVCQNRCEYSSIQAAINAANIGDTINVQSGSYNEDVVINKDINLVYLGTVVVNRIFTCGHKVQGSLIASTVSDGCNPEAFKGRITGGPITVGGKTLMGDSDQGSMYDDRASKLLYSEDFSNEQSGWAINEGQMGYENGEYQVIASGGHLVYGGVNKIFTDFALEVQARLKSGSNKDDYGVIFRRVDGENFYRFAISGEGNYKFNKLLNGKWVDIGSAAHSNAILTGKRTNTIRIECKGREFTFYINNIKLAEYTDKSFAKGNIGLEAGSSGGLTQASFDNLKVWAI